MVLDQFAIACTAWERCSLSSAFLNKAGWNAELGIAPEFLSHVFDRFSQADGSSKRKHSGLGLGLAIVRHLVELHGGEVSVTSLGLDQGATFVVKLPLTGQPEVGHRLGEHQVEVRMAGGMAEALEVFEAWRPAILILDMGMPGIECK